VQPRCRSASAAAATAAAAADTALGNFLVKKRVA